LVIESLEDIRRLKTGEKIMQKTVRKFVWVSMLAVACSAITVPQLAAEERHGGRTASPGHHDRDRDRDLVNNRAHDRNDDRKHDLNDDRKHDLKDNDAKDDRKHDLKDNDAKDDRNHNRGDAHDNDR
jgi:hypothetical protein